MNIRILYLFIILVSLFIFSCDYETTPYKALCSIETPSGSCPDGKSCINGSCSIKCNPDCEEWQTCNDGICKTADNRCLKRSDCLSPNSICEDHICKKVVDLCENISCSDHGSCKIEDEKAKCICDDGYLPAGLNCVKRDPCNDFICGRDEVCSAPSDIPKCICADGYIRDSEDVCIKDTPIDWSVRCPDYIIGENGEDIQCALVEVPLNYDNPDGEKIEIFIFRVLHSGAENSGQVLFLQGGPGGSGAIFSSFFEEYKNKYPNFDLYSIDHRGVGNSVDLRCDNENSINDIESFQRCTTQLNAEWGERLKEFSTNNAAKDLGFIFNKIKKAEVKQFLYGVSYGTYWAERYLYFFPNQIDGVILDSIASINNTWMDDYNIGFQTVGETFMDVVAQDPIASEKLSPYGETPIIALENFYTKVENNMACDLGWNLSLQDWKTIFGTSLRSFYSRIFIPSLLYRLHRCNTSDKTIIETYINNLFELSGRSISGRWVDEEELDSDLLYYNVTFSELWKGNSLDEILAIENSSLFISSSIESLYNFYTEGNWNSYLDDGTFRAWPDTDIPILMINGTLDPQTPLEIALPSAEHFNKANQTFIEFPQTPHGVIMSSLMNNLEGYCGEIVIFDFLNNPTKKVDKSCVDNLYQLEFSSDSEVNIYLSNYFYETDDMWEGTQNKNSNIDLELQRKIKRSFKIK